MVRIATPPEPSAYCTQCGVEVSPFRGTWHIVNSKGHSRDRGSVVMEIDGELIPVEQLQVRCPCGYQGSLAAIRTHLTQAIYRRSPAHPANTRAVPLAFLRPGSNLSPEETAELQARLEQARRDYPPKGVMEPPTRLEEGQPTGGLGTQASALVTDDAPTPEELLGAGAISLPIATAGDGGAPLTTRLDTEVLTADPARINVQLEVPAWLITMWDVGYRARGYDGTFARWVVELLTLHFVKCKGISLGIIVRPPQPVSQGGPE